MKVKNLATFFLFGSFLLNTGCSEEPKFSFFCERDKQGNYTIKWEVSSAGSHDEINIYMSDNDSLFVGLPILKTKINDYVANISTQSPIYRKYFRLKVKNTFSGVITNRFFKLDSLQNFRDVGGYYTREGRQMKWGRLYRSGELTDVSSNDINKLKSLKIKTIIDFRDEEERQTYPNRYTAENMVYLPMRTENRAYIREKIIDGSFLRGDALLFTQDTYKVLVENYAYQFAKFFDILSNEQNYPIIFHGHLGKDRVGLANYFLLRALGIPSDTNEEEYLLSNSYINEAEVMGEARFLPEQMQEAATIICQSHMAYLNYARTCMIRKSGSVEEYMEKELKLTADKKEKLKEILLYR